MWPRLLVRGALHRRQVDNSCDTRTQKTQSSSEFLTETISKTLENVKYGQNTQLSKVSIFGSCKQLSALNEGIPRFIRKYILFCLLSLLRVTGFRALQIAG